MATNIYYLIQPLCVRNSGVIWLGGSGSGSLTRSKSRYWQGLQSFKDLNRLEDQFLKKFSHMAGKLVLPFGKIFLLLALWTSSKGSWMSSQHGSWLPSEKIVHGSKTQITMFFMTWQQKYTLPFPQYLIGSTSQPSLVWGEMIL